MKAAILYGPRDIRVEEISDPKIEKPTDAILKLTYTCICGSDLWWYRGIDEIRPNFQIGHEFVGEVIETGNEVTDIQVGDIVVGPFFWCDGSCPECKAGMSSACRNGTVFSSAETPGCQAEKLRVPFADANLFSIPKDKQNKETMPSVLALSDVMGTGHHAAVSGGVSEGKTVAVVGDGAVGLCAVLASKRLGAKKIILLSSHEDRQRIGKKFGATDIVAERGEAAIKKVKELTGDLGVDCALECVGNPDSWHEVYTIVRAGGKIGFVGVPHKVPNLKLEELFTKNYTIGGGIAPTRTYIPQLLPEVLSGELDPSPIFDMRLPLSEIAKGYEAMDKRQALKVLINPNE